MLHRCRRPSPSSSHPAPGETSCAVFDRSRVLQYVPCLSRVLPRAQRRGRSTRSARFSFRSGCRSALSLSTITCFMFGGNLYSQPAVPRGSCCSALDFDDLVVIVVRGRGVVRKRKAPALLHDVGVCSAHAPLPQCDRGSVLLCSHSRARVGTFDRRRCSRVGPCVAHALRPMGPCSQLRLAAARPSNPSRVASAHCAHSVLDSTASARTVGRRGPSLGRKGLEPAIRVASEAWLRCRVARTTNGGQVPPRFGCSAHCTLAYSGRWT